MTSRLRVACAGAGYFSRFQYEAWTRLDTVELAATANRTRADAEAIAEAYAIPAVFESVPEMLDQAKPDLLDIITPPETHLAAIKAAAERGIDAICQKPFCRNLKEAREATAIAADAGIHLIIHENFRFQPWHRKIKSLLTDGMIGDAYQITFRLRPGDGQGPEAYLDRQPYFQTMERFLVHETAIHQIDTFRFLMGEVKSVYADLRRLNPAIAGEDAGLIVFDFGAGVRGLFDGNRLSDHKARNRRLTMGEMLVEGSAGVIALDGDGEIRLRTHGSDDWREISYDWRDHAFGGDCVYLTQKAAIAGLRGEGPIENPADDYLVNIAIEEAVYQSARDMRRVELANQ